MIAVSTELRKIGLSGAPDTAGAMPRTASALGICVTCNYVDTCTGRASWLGPVFHCEEFDDRIEAAPGEASLADRGPQIGAGIESPALFGLCVNCDHRTNCGFRGQEGGVWHCEEYE